jgi:hypothetical protein
MNLAFRFSKKDKPIRVITKLPQSDYVKVVGSKDVDVAKIGRAVKFGESQLRKDGNLYFGVQDPLCGITARIVWLHVTKPGHVLEVHYPNRSTQKKPYDAVVTVYPLDDRICVKVDGILWTFYKFDARKQPEGIADPQIWTHLVDELKDPREVIVALCEYVIQRDEMASAKSRK